MSGMEVKQLVSKAFEAFKQWSKEREQDGYATTGDDIESYFSSYMYGELVDLQWDHKADNETLGAYVRAMNEMVESLLKRYELDQHGEAFQNIMQLDEPLRTQQLSKLMDTLQRLYQIPLLNNLEFNEKHPELMNLYRAVSAARDL